jgi:hypothetical protein
MTAAKDILPESACAGGVSDFTITLKRILELLDLEEEDDYGILKPTEYAFKMAIQWVIEAYEIVGSSFPRASSSTDEMGGIRLSWENTDKDCRIRIFCPSAPDKVAYVYHQKGDDYGSEDLVSAATLVQWIEWFNQA